MFENWNGMPDRHVDLEIHNSFRDIKRGELRYKFASMFDSARSPQTDIIILDIPDDVDPFYHEFLILKDENSAMVCPRYTASLDLTLALIDKHVKVVSRILTEFDGIKSVAISDGPNVYAGTGCTLIEAALKTLYSALQRLEQPVKSLDKKQLRVVK